MRQCQVFFYFFTKFLSKTNNALFFLPEMVLSLRNATG